MQLQGGVFLYLGQCGAQHCGDTFSDESAPMLSNPKPQYIVINGKSYRKILWFLLLFALPTERDFLRAAFDKRPASAPLSPRKNACYNLFITKRFRSRGNKNV